METIKYIAVAQLSGVVEENSTISGNFAAYEDALEWATNYLSAAHDPPEIVAQWAESYAPYVLFGHPEITVEDVTPAIKQLHHSGGPTTAWIIEVTP